MRAPNHEHTPTVPEQERRGKQRSLEGGFGTGVGAWPNIATVPHVAGDNAELKAHPIMVDLKLSPVFAELL